jgi:hypothetical protein
LVVLVMVFAAPALPASGAGTGATAIYPVVLDDLGLHVAGQPTEFTAMLVDSDTPVPHALLSLWLQPSGSSDWQEAGRATTDDSGRATVVTVLERNAAVQWRVGESAEPAQLVSTPYVVQIAPVITRRANDRTLHRGQRLVVRGHTYPVKAGCAVELWRGELRPLVVGPKPVRLARATVRADGGYRLVHRFHHRLRARIAVVVPACADNGAGLSAYLGLRVR